MIDKVVVDVEGQSEWTEARVHWAGGHETYTRFRRPVARLEQLSNWPRIRDRITELRTQGCTVPEIVDVLNREHLRAAKQRPFTRVCVATWLSRFGLATTVRARRGPRVETSPE